MRLMEQKGITYLLKAMPEIVSHFPDISLVIAGEGPLEEQLKKEAHTLGVQENIFFAGPRLDMPELLKLFDLYVLPSLWEGLPMVLLEAMAAGCPIVATDVGGNFTAIKHGQNGSLVQPGDPGQLAGEIIMLLNDKAVLRKYSLNSKLIFNKRFEAAVMSRKYESLYLQSSLDSVGK